MANVSSVNPSVRPMTIEEALALADQAKKALADADLRIAAAEAKNKALAEQLAKKTEITWGFSEFGKGAIVLRGFTRMGISFYPSQIPNIFGGPHVPKLIAFSEASATVDESRRRGVAYEFADKAYLKAHPGTDMDAFHTTYNSAKKLPTEWKDLYNTGLKMASEQPSLMSEALAKRVTAGK